MAGFRRAIGSTKYTRASLSAGSGIAQIAADAFFDAPAAAAPSVVGFKRGFLRVAARRYHQPIARKLARVVAASIVVMAGGNAPQNSSIPAASIGLQAYAPTVTASSGAPGIVTFSRGVQRVFSRRIARTASYSLLTAPSGGGGGQTSTIPAAATTLQAYAPATVATQDLVFPAKRGVQKPPLRGKARRLGRLLPILDYIGPQVVLIPTAAVTLQAPAPTVSNGTAEPPRIVTFTRGTLRVAARRVVRTSYFAALTAPTGGSPQTSAIPAASLVLQAYAPSSTATQDLVFPAKRGVQKPPMRGKARRLGRLLILLDTNNRVSVIPAANLLLQAPAPSSVVTTNQLVALPAASLVLAAYVPIVSNGGSQVSSIPAAALVLQAFPPSSTAGGNLASQIPTAGLQLHSYAPNSVITGSSVIALPSATLTLQAFPPTFTSSGDTPYRVHRVRVRNNGAVNVRRSDGVIVRATDPAKVNT